MRVLVVEDDEKTADVIRRALERDAIVVDLAADGEEGLRLGRLATHDVIVLDVMLPDRSGFEVCGALRQGGVWTPVLMLTARDAVADRVAGLDSGADDYLVKPFAIAELLARLRSLARRNAPERPTVLVVGDLTLDPATRSVVRDGTPIFLSAKEFAVLEALMRRSGVVLSRLQLIEHAWDMAYEAQSNVVDVYVRRLREKIDRPFGLTTLETVPGVGYVLRDDRR